MLTIKLCLWSNTHKLITEYMLDVGSIRGLPANLYSVHVTATGSMQHLIYRSCQIVFLWSGNLYSLMMICRQL